jgi:hypothetical protein
MFPQSFLMKETVNKTNTYAKSHISGNTNASLTQLDQYHDKNTGLL